MGLIEAVCVVHEVRPDDVEQGTETAIDKRPVNGPVAVRLLGLHGDKQMDSQDHGGPDKAVYAFAGEDASWWAGALDRDVPAGMFGENLRTTGVDVTGAVIGERWRLGGAGGAVLEVTQPRIPCSTFQRWMAEPHWVKRFPQHGTPGAYLRVVAEGTVEAGDRVTVEQRPSHGVTIGSCFGGFGADVGRRLIEAHDAGEIELAGELRRYCERSLART